MLYTFFDNLRTKPKIVRDQYALLGAVCFTLMIGGVWSLSIPARLSSVALNASSTNIAAVGSTQASGFFSQLKSQFKSAKTAVVTPSPTNALAPTAASSAVAALELQLSPENRQLKTVPTSNIVFGTTTIAPAIRSDTPATSTASTASTASTTSSTR